MEEKLTYYGKEQGASSMADQSSTRIGQEESQRRKVDLLMQDKEYLTKENIQLIEKNRRLEDRLERLYTSSRGNFTTDNRLLTARFEVRIHEKP